MHKLESEIAANYGSEVLARFKALQVEWESALRIGDCERAREITAIQDSLFECGAGAGKRPSAPSPAQQLTDLFEAMMLFNTGVSLYKAREFIAAAVQFELVIQLAGSHGTDQERNLAADAWMHKGGSLACLGRLGEAIDCYDRAIELKPDDANFRREREHAIEWQRTHERR